MASGIKVVAVVGPTASGKTALGARLALHFGGEVVSGDSMQIYKGMDIATAKPSPEETLGVPHHLIGYVSPEEKYSAARYVSDAAECINGIVSRGRLPFVVGGTGLYIDSLLFGVEFSHVPDSSEIRKKLYERLGDEGAEALWNELREKDPEAAEAIHVNNTVRVIRALEIYELTGQTVTEQKRLSRLKVTAYDPLYILIEYADRNRLYERIDRRVELMLAAGLEEEARAFFASPAASSPTAAQAIGYKELAPYIRGEETLEAAAASLKTATRHYAKRQMTWFRRNTSAFVIRPDENEDYFEDCVGRINRFLYE